MERIKLHQDKVQKRTGAEPKSSTRSGWWGWMQGDTTTLSRPVVTGGLVLSHEDLPCCRGCWGLSSPLSHVAQHEHQWHCPGSYGANREDLQRALGEKMTHNNSADFLLNPSGQGERLKWEWMYLASLTAGSIVSVSDTQCLCFYDHGVFFYSEKKQQTSC